MNFAWIIVAAILGGMAGFFVAALLAVGKRGEEPITGSDLLFDAAFSDIVMQGRSLVAGFFNRTDLRIGSRFRIPGVIGTKRVVGVRRILMVEDDEASVGEVPPQKHIAEMREKHV
jgi:hypothetical protein